MARTLSEYDGRQLAAIFALPINISAEDENLPDTDYLWEGQPVPLIRILVENIAIWLVQKKCWVGVIWDVLVYLIFRVLTETDEVRLSQLLYEFGITANYHSAAPMSDFHPDEGRPPYDVSEEHIVCEGVNWFFAQYSNYNFNRAGYIWADY